MKATTLDNTWMAKMVKVRVRSCMGPVSLKIKFIRVKLLHSIMLTVVGVSESVSTSTTYSLTLATLIDDKIPSDILPNNPSSVFWKCAVEVVTVSASLSYLGSLCLGQGTRWNSWGKEYKKLKT